MSDLSRNYKRKVIVVVVLQAGIGVPDLLGVVAIG